MKRTTKKTEPQSPPAFCLKSKARNTRREREAQARRAQAWREA